MDIPIKNHGKTDRYVGGKLITPGETRLVAAHLVPTNLRNEDGQPVKQGADSGTDDKTQSPEDLAIAELRECKVSEITEALPNLSDEDLDRLYAAEEADEKPRKGVLEAIEAERLKRAAGEGG